MINKIKTRSKNLKLLISILFFCIGFFQFADAMSRARAKRLRKGKQTTEQRLAVSEEKLEGARNVVERMTERYRELRLKFEWVNGRLAAMKSKSLGLQSDLEQAMDIRVDDVTRMIGLQNMIFQLQEQLKGSREATQAKEKEQADLRARIEELQRLLDKTTGQVESSNRRVHELIDELYKVNGAIEEVSKQYSLGEGEQVS